MLHDHQKRSGVIDCFGQLWYGDKNSVNKICVSMTVAYCIIGQSNASKSGTVSGSSAGRLSCIIFSLPVDYTCSNVIFTWKIIYSHSRF